MLGCAAARFVSLGWTTVTARLNGEEGFVTEGFLLTGEMLGENLKLAMLRSFSIFFWWILAFILGTTFADGTRC